MPQPNVPDVPTWEDFPEFYENEFVKAIAGNPKWTVSDKDKRPIDMHALIELKKIWGVAWDRGYNPLVDLATVCSIIPTAVNNAYYLDALTDGYVVMDVEPSCPDALKEQFLGLPYIYAETSMSGKGLHLVFETPVDLLEKYPIAKKKLSLQHSTGYYEILLNHMVTFTRNSIGVSKYTQGPDSFRNIFELLAMNAKETSTLKGEKIDPELELDEIPYAAALIRAISGQEYKKTIKDFVNKKSGHYDTSAFEFGTAGFYFSRLQRIMPNRVYKDHKYTDQECTRIVYEVIRKKLPERAKHEEIRYGMPWLCYIASTIVVRNSDPDNPTSYRNLNKKKDGKPKKED